jgi:hypothetical protein
LSPGPCGRRVAFNASTGAEINSKTNHTRSPFNECREPETRVLRKITLRIVPFVMLLYFIALCSPFCWR